ncbi:secretin and TonB N-terminal domain-containing protein [Persephonella sp.]
MDRVYKIVLVISIILFSSCGLKNSKDVENIQSDKAKKKENIYQKEREIKYKPVIKPPPKIVKPVLKKISPLEGKFFSFSADKAPLKAVLYAIANDTGMNLIIAPDVNPDVLITANFNNTPVKDALKVITDMTGVYYQIKGNIIYIKGSITKTFHIPYVHTNTGFNSKLGGDVLGGALQTGGGTTGGSTTGAGSSGGTTTSISGDFSLTYKNPEEINDFYKQIEDGLKNILQARSNTTGTAFTASLSKNEFTLNKFTGTLIVTASKDKMKKVEKFLKKILTEVKKQVLIEAKIVEVTLSESTQYGINWSSLLRNVSGITVSLSQTLALPQSYGEVVVAGTDFNAVINALATVGKIETLSNPRIRVVNGQTALISSGVVVPYWEKQITTLGTTTISQSVMYLRRSILSGILLGVTPYVEDDHILINIVPVSTKIEGTKQLLDNNQVVAEAPILNIKEAGTIIKVKDGDLIIIGGMINTENRTREDKIPVLGDIPLLGNLFKRKYIFKEKKELIIFLKPRIITEFSR